MDTAPPTRRIVKAACPHDRHDTCVLDNTVEDDRAFAVRGTDMPFTAGTLRTRVARYLDRTYSPSRILYTMKRNGRKDEGRFERISRDEAPDTFTAFVFADNMRVRAFNSRRIGRVPTQSLCRQFRT